LARRQFDDFFRRVVDDLNAIRARFALIGGLAISLRAMPRTTEDVDSSGLEPEIARDATLMRLFGRSVPVASLPHLVALKILSQSPARQQDLEDLRCLLGVATKGDIDETRAALALITARRCARGKNLEDRLVALLRRYRPDCR
jgi:hypothetical protein